MVYSSLIGYYQLLKTIGNGGFGKVKQAIHLLTGEHVAIKIIDKAKLANDVPRIALEIKAMKDLRHQHICQLYQVIETEEYFFLVLEYFSNGELFDYIVNQTRLSEEQARHFFRQIVSAVAFMHKKGYCHRDLKPENLLLDRHEDLKLIDFGLCAEPKEGIQSTYLGTACGSPAYAAPELIAGQNYRGDAADIWSLGVLLYALLCGTLPFDDDNIASMYGKIQNGIYLIPPWLSSESVTLLRQLLQVNPMKRIRIDDLLRHPWLLNHAYPQAIEWQSSYRESFDLTCLREMSIYYGQTVDEITRELSQKRYDYMTATYFILLDLKSRNKPLCLASHNRSHSFGHSIPIPLHLLQGRNHGTAAQSLPPANLLLISQQKTNEIPTNKENQRPADEVFHPSTQASHCQRFLKFNELSGTARCVHEKKGDQRMTISRSCNDALDEDNLDDLKIAPSVKAFSLGAVDSDDFHVDFTPQRQKKNVRSIFGSVERGLNTVKQILTPKRVTINKPRKTWEKANMTLFNLDDFDLLCDLLERAIQVNSQLKYQEKGSRFLYNIFIGDDWGKIVLEFDLEIVLIQGKQLGIQRKRTKGNAWHYKRCCEDITKELMTLLSQIQS